MTTIPDDTTLTKLSAELDGWEMRGESWYHPLWGYPTISRHGVPNYLTSYNAILPLIQKWVKTHINPHGVIVKDEVKMQKFISALWDLNTGEGDIDLTDVYSDKHGLIAFALGFDQSPRQLTIALLKAHGKI